MADEIVDASDRAAGIVRQFLTFAKRLPGDATSIQVTSKRSWVNLVLNARDACSDGGTVRVLLTDLRSGDSRAGVRLDVEDDGEGMSDVERAHMFDPFYTTRGVGRPGD